MNLLPSWVGAQVFPLDSIMAVSDEDRTLQSLILCGARVEVVTLNSQILASKIADPNMKFIKLEYSSLEELKRRISVLYLQTLEHKNKSFIQFFNMQHLLHPFLMSKLRKIW